MTGLLRKLPHFRGKFRLIRFLFRRILNSSTNTIVKGRYGLQYLLPNLKENIAFEIFADGIYEPETSSLIVKELVKDGVFIDIGANIGSITIPVCMQRPDVKAVCIEASPFVFSYLKKNIELNRLSNCILINKIVSDSDKEMKDFFSPGELFGKGSMAPSFSATAEKIETITIDSLLAQLNIVKADFIKIDIEGYEYFTFKGAANILSAGNAPDIFFEFLDCAETEEKGLKPGDAQKLLLQYGYTLYAAGKNKTVTRINHPLQKGEAMIFATKKQSFANII